MHRYQLAAPAYGALLLALCIVLPQGASAREIDKSFHESFVVAKGAALQLVHGDGDVSITPWDKDEIDVEVVYRATVTKVGIGAKPDFDVRFEQKGDRVRVVGEEQGDGVTLGFYSEDTHVYQYTIKAPSYVRLELDGDDGNVRVEGWRSDIHCRIDDGDLEVDGLANGELFVRFEDGNVELTGIRGAIELEGDDGDVLIDNCELDGALIEVQDGDVSVRRSSGVFEIEIDDGNVELERVECPELEITAQDGDVEVELLGRGEVDWTIQTDDGSIYLDFEDGVSARWVVENEGGKRLDFPGAPRIEDDEERIQGELGSGRGRIQLRSSDGDIRMREMRGT